MRPCTMYRKAVPNLLSPLFEPVQYIVGNRFLVSDTRCDSTYWFASFMQKWDLVLQLWGRKEMHACTHWAERVLQSVQYIRAQLKRFQILTTISLNRRYIVHGLSCFVEGRLHFTSSLAPCPCQPPLPPASQPLCPSNLHSPGLGSEISSTSAVFNCFFLLPVFGSGGKCSQPQLPGSSH
jgi:hypothetical protein